MRINKSDVKAVLFLLFASLVLLGAYFAIIWEVGALTGVAAMATGVFLLGVFTKIAAK